MTPTPKPFFREKYRINRKHHLAPNVACWLFNEAAGDRVYDLSGNGYHGTFTNAPAWLISAIAPHIPVVDFPKSANEKIVCDGLLSVPNEGTLVLSIESDAWPTSGQQYRICGHDDAFEFTFGQSGAGASDVFHNQAFVSGTNGLVTSSLSTGTVYQFVATWNYGATRLKIYQDGVLVGTDTSAINVSSVTPSAFYIGDSRNLNQTINGRVGYMWILDRELTDQEAAEVYYNPFGFLHKPPAIYIGALVSIFNESVALANTAALATLANAISEGAATLTASATAPVQGDVSAEGTTAIAAVSTISTAAIADLQGLITVDGQYPITVSSVAQMEAALSLLLTGALSTYTGQSLDVAVSLTLTAAASASGAGEAEGGVSMATSVVASIVAQALCNAGIEFDSVITENNDIVITTKNRTIRISAENRTVIVT